MMKALLVDDNAYSKEMLGAILESENVTCVKVNNADEALEVFVNSEIDEFDIIFMDIVMDNTPGNIAADRIRALDRKDAKRVRIFATTALANYVDDNEKGKSFNGMLLKPLNREAIIDIINKCKV